MADYERRNNGYRGGGGGSGGGGGASAAIENDEDFDRRPSETEIRGATAARRVEDDVVIIAKTVAENYDDEELRDTLINISLTSLFAYNNKPELGTELLNKAASALQKYIDSGSWREVKLLVRFLGCLQPLFESDGIFTLLEELFARAVDLQTASSEDLLGLELVKIILFTIPYVMSSPATGFESQASALLEKTDIIASTPHALVDLVNISGQLQGEASKGWELKCLPRPWKDVRESDGDEQKPFEAVAKIAFPQITVPNPEVDTVPPVSDITSSLLRDALVDTLNLLDFNRVATAKYLIDLWKPEDMAVDAVFSQLFQLPTPEHKLVYYHSVLTECCKIASAAIAPSLGRAIRFLYNSLETMDLELSNRFLDWFAHHLSNFGFTWKWSEWKDKELGQLIRKKATDDELQPIIAAIEEQAQGLGVEDPKVPSTDALVASICFVGSKSLSTSCTIERNKDRLLAVGAASEKARLQIITSVMVYWADQTGIAINIIDKLLNYTIISPMSVLEWALIDHIEAGAILSKPHIYEMIAATVGKVTNRMRQIVAARTQKGLYEPQLSVLEDTLIRERVEMRNLFKFIEDAVVSVATGSNDELMERGDGSVDMPERHPPPAAVEDAFISDALVNATPVGTNAPMREDPADTAADGDIHIADADGQ
ncbi:uncharacterized protein N7473_011038 [Penicillium subrubescens]|uniref:uncharacterized protein n=1 Tax=Penicillium subrubescens TaxID=1316194 RepID=UPI002545091B|nr:uncharacterized protein N7473_011038 [Penicillium subrubescens]KAJ5884152.1 hypothetical protein N7473_011038 [Penicillium subrubescens]